MDSGITVVGTGAVVGQRDTCTLDLAAEVQAGSAPDAMSAVSSAANAMRAAVLAAGVSESALTTGGISLSPVFDPYPRVTGYVAGLRLVVRTREVGTVGQLLAAAVAAGGDAARVQGISFGHDDPAALVARAREEAWADAHATARRYAALAGVTLGPVEAVQEGAAHPGPAPARMVAMAKSDAPPVDAGEGTVTASVMVRWSIR